MRVTYTVRAAASESAGAAIKRVQITPLSSLANGHVLQRSIPSQMGEVTHIHARRPYFVSFSPAISVRAKKAISKKIRDWHLNRRSGSDLSALALEINPQVRGWINYYGAFYRSELYSIARRIYQHLVRWAMRKFKRFRGKPLAAWAQLKAAQRLSPRLFVHWHLLSSSPNRPARAG